MKINHWNSWKIEQNISPEQVRQTHVSYKTSRFMWDRHLSHLPVSPKYVRQASGTGACRTYKAIGFMWDRRLSHLFTLVLCETGKWDKRLSHIKTHWFYVRQAPVPLHVSLNISYFLKVITWATCVRFRRIIYRFEAYDETKQIQNCILHFIHINVLHIHFTRFCSVKSYFFCFFIIFKFNGFRCTSII